MSAGNEAIKYLIVQFTLKCAFSESHFCDYDLLRKFIPV